MYFSKFYSRELYCALAEALDIIPWKHPKHLADSIGDILGGEDNFKSAMIIGTRKLGSIIESDELYVGLVYLSPGAVYPPHAHDATELYHTLLGSALWGPSLKHLTTVKPGNFVLHSSAQPHAFKVIYKWYIQTHNLLFHIYIGTRCYYTLSFVLINNRSPKILLRY